MSSQRTTLDIAYEQFRTAQREAYRVARSGTMADSRRATDWKFTCGRRLLVEVRLSLPHPQHCAVCNTEVGDDTGSYYHRLSCKAQHYGDWLKDTPRIKELETALEYARNTGD